MTITFETLRRLSRHELLGQVYGMAYTIAGFAMARGFLTQLVMGRVVVIFAKIG